jgi:phage recombination protein Bet
MSDPIDFTKFSKEDIEAARQAICPTPANKQPAPDSIIRLILHRCAQLGADPFAKMIYAVERKGQWTLQCSIDLFRATAETGQGYAGQEGPYWCGDDGIWKDVWLDKKAPRAAKVGVLRSSFTQPLYSVALFDAYAQSPNESWSLWHKMPSLMIAKCAEALAIRRAFPAKLSGIYTADEMNQADTISQAPAQVALPPAAVTQVATPVVIQDPEIMLHLRNVGAKLGKLAGSISADLAKASSPQALLEHYEGELEQRPPRTPSETPKPAPVDQSQVAAIADLISAFSKSSMKHTEFDEKLVVCSSVTGRKIEQYSDLTPVEAQAVIAEVNGMYGVVETESASAELVKKLQMELKDSDFVEKTLKRSKAYGNAEAAGASQADCMRDARLAWAKHVLKIEALKSFNDLTEEQVKTLLVTASRGK